MPHASPPRKQIALDPSFPQKHVFLTFLRCFPRSQVARSTPTSKKLKPHSTRGWKRNLVGATRWCVLAFIDPSPLSHPLYQDVYQSDCPLLVAMIYPLVSSQQLRQILDYCAAVVMLDDLLYGSFHCSLNMGSGHLHSERSPSEYSQDFIQMWMNILRNGNKGKIVQHSPIEMMLRLVDPFALSACLILLKHS